MQLKTLYKQVNFYSTVQGWRCYATGHASKKTKKYLNDHHIAGVQLIYDSFYEMILSLFFDLLDDESIERLCYKAYDSEEE